MLFAGVVVLYNPDLEVFDNINSYYHELDRLYVCDNSEQPNEEIVTKIKALPNVEYIGFGENRGVSYALNTGLNLSGNCKFLLTMDQDSKFEKGMMKKYKNTLIKNYIDDNNVVMYAVNYNDLKSTSDEVQIVDHAITSGSVLNKRIVEAIGGLEEKLFIDYVDYELCYRAALYGYKTLYFTGIYLKHHLGNPLKRTIFGITIASLNHNKVRKYYIARNIIYIIKKYPSRRVQYFKTLIKHIAKVILLEEEKFERIKYMTRGIMDGIAGKMGKLKGT